MRRGGSALWYVVAVVLAIASVVAAIALAVLTLVGETGNKDRYGRVPIPASQVVALDSGEVALNYEERTDVDDGEGLSVPTDLRVTVTAQGDERPLDLEDSSLEESYNYNDRAGHSYARVDIPEEGRYRVRTAGATNRNRPSIAFGSPPHYGRGLLLALAVFIGGILAAVTIVVATLVRSRRRRRAPAGAGGASGPAPPDPPSNPFGGP